MILRYTGSHGMLVALVSYDIVIYLLCVSYFTVEI